MREGHEHVAKTFRSTDRTVTQKHKQRKERKKSGREQDGPANGQEDEGSSTGAPSLHHLYVHVHLPLPVERIIKPNNRLEKFHAGWHAWEMVLTKSRQKSVQRRVLAYPAACTMTMLVHHSFWYSSSPLLALILRLPALPRR